MEKFKRFISRAIFIETDNIDTDQIIPARFLKTTEKTGLGKYMFYNWRYTDDGKTKNNIFDKRENQGSHLRQGYDGQAKILVAGKYFGTGSSREHAVWALLDYGLRTVISSEFGDIFYNNSLKNGLLCIKLNDTGLKKLSEILIKNPETELSINLENQKIEIQDKNIYFNFDIDSFRKSCLLMGVDELGYILSHADKISEYEKKISNF